MKQKLITLLKRGKILIKNTPEKYLLNTDCNAVDGSSILKQIRHILEDVRAFNQGIDLGHIDFTVRKRDHRIEESKSFCLEVFSGLIAELKNKEFNEIDTIQFTTQVGDICLSQSVSIIFVMTFLYSHIEHHYPPMAMCLSNVDGLRYIPESFGINYLTLNG